MDAGTSSGSGAAIPDAPADAFSAMGQAASQSNAFTHGMEGPELAAHERKRKAERLKEAPVRGRNTADRKTKEPAIEPQARVDAFPKD
eukprot:1915997-Prymnesium_polylepis.1